MNIDGEWLDWGCFPLQTSGLQTLNSAKWHIQLIDSSFKVWNMQNSVILGICSVPSLSCSVPIILQNSVEFCRILQNSVELLQNSTEFYRILHNSAEFCRIGTKIGHTFSPLLCHIDRIRRHVVKDNSKFDSLHLSKVIFNHDKYV